MRELHRNIKSKFGVSVYQENTHFVQKCSGCLCKLHDGEAVVYLSGACKYHRQCVKDFMEWTYESVPASLDERRAAQGGLLEQIDTERAQKEFDAYRAKIISKLHHDPSPDRTELQGPG